MRKTRSKAASKNSIDRGALAAEREILAAKLRTREGEHGFAANCAAIKARLAEIDALLGGG